MRNCWMPRSGPDAAQVFKRVKAVHIAACGTSYHAGLVASYFIEQICRIPARVEIASEYRYRDPVITPDTLFVTISQSGETADTLAALRNAKPGALSVHAHHLQRGRKLHGAGVGIGAADARRPGDRRRLDQGVHHAADRAGHAGRGAREARLAGRRRASGS